MRVWNENHFTNFIVIQDLYYHYVSVYPWAAQGRCRGIWHTISYHDYSRCINSNIVLMFIIFAVLAGP